MRKIPAVWIWLATCTTLLVAVGLATCRYQYHCEETEEQVKAQGASSSGPPIDNRQAAHESQKHEDGTPWWYKLVAWPEGITVWVIYLTLFAIGWQARLMAKHAEHFAKLADAASDNTSAAKSAADAALLQAKHMETTERAWLLVSFVSMKDRELRDGEVAECRWAIKNVGSTPAILLETKARFHVLRLYDGMPEDPEKMLPSHPNYGKAIVVNERLLAPQDSMGFFTKWERDVDGAFSEFAFPSKDSEIWMVVAYGYAKYKDIFGKERESRSCDFTVIGKGGQIVTEFKPNPKAPAAYNQCT